LYEFQDGFDNENYSFEPTLTILARHLLDEVGWGECDTSRGCRQMDHFRIRLLCPIMAPKNVFVFWLITAVWTRQWHQRLQKSPSCAYPVFPDVRASTFVRQADKASNVNNKDNPSQSLSIDSIPKVWHSSQFGTSIGSWLCALFAEAIISNIEKPEGTEWTRRLQPPPLAIFMSAICSIFSSSSSHGLPEHQIAKHPLRFVSLEFGRILLISPTALEC
jgi:hypothetical protein